MRAIETGKDLFRGGADLTYPPGAVDGGVSVDSPSPPVGVELGSSVSPTIRRDHLSASGPAVAGPHDSNRTSRASMPSPNLQLSTSLGLISRLPSS